MNRDFLSDALRRVLGKKAPTWLIVLLGLCATAVFYAFAYHARYADMDDYPGYKMDQILQITAVMLTALFAVSAAIQLRVARGLPFYALVGLMVITGAVLLGKISLFDCDSDDYDIFLSVWIYAYTKLGFKEGLGTYIGSDYGPPYLYFLQLISNVRDYPWQYMVRAFSMAFEILMSYSVMKLVSLHTKSVRTQVLMYHIVSMLPTVVYNGARWGQCDVIYTSFCLLALYLAMSGKSARSCFFFGLALAYKLQMVFLLPALLPLWLRKDIKLRHLPLIPGAYMLMMLPALWGGKSMHHVLTVYLQQAGQYNTMSMNSQSLYQIFNSGAGLKMGALFFQMFFQMSMLLAFALLLGVCALLIAHRERITNEVLLLSVVFIAEGVPFFLPKMHERYTFAGGVLSVVLMAFNPKLAVVTLLLDFAAMICYTAGLPGDTLIPLPFATIFQIAALTAACAALVCALRRGQKAMEVKA